MNSTVTTSESAEEQENDAPHLLGLLPFTINSVAPPFFGLTNPHNFTHANRAFTHMAAALLAVDHFNDRNPTVVPELTELGNCTFQLPSLVFQNTDGDPYQTSQALMRNSRNDNILAMVGPYTSQAALTAATFASGLDVPLVVHGVEDFAFSRSLDHPRVANTAVNIHAMAEAVVNYALSRLGRSQALATIHVPREVGDQYMQAINDNLKVMELEGRKFTQHLVQSMVPPFTGPDDQPGTIGFALNRVQRSGIRNIVLVLKDTTQLAIVADEVAARGMNTGIYTWIFAVPRALDLGEIAHLANHNNNANVTQLVAGMAHIALLDGFTANPQTDPFLQEWKRQNATFVERVNQLHPIRRPHQEGYFQAPGNYFPTHDPLPGAGFLYDAVMSVGLGKCRELAQAKQHQAEQEEEESANANDNKSNGGNGVPSTTTRDRIANNGNNRRRGRVRGLEAHKSIHNNNNKRRLQMKVMGATPPNAFHEAITYTKFHGATGQVQFRERPRFWGSRPRDTVIYGAYNFRSAAVEQDPNNNNQPLWYYLTHVLKGNPMTGTWEATSNAPFVFANGLNTPPLLNRDLPEQNYLPQSIQIGGLTLMAIALLTALVSALFVQVRKSKDLHIRQAQPPFLMLLILGASLLSSSIFTLSFDESYSGWAESSLDAMCMATPWLVFLGYNTIYLALFCKLWRLDKVMQFKRVQVKASHVGLPFVASMLASIAILIAWTVVDPLQWVRKEIDPVTYETYGKCSSENPLPYFIPLFCLMGLSTVACGLMAFKCRDIDSRYSETNNIFHTIFAQVQVLLVGLPVMVILDDASAGATYMGKALLIFVVAMSTLILMILPLVLRTLSSSTGSLSVSTRNAGSGRVRVSMHHHRPPVIAGLPGSSKSRPTNTEDSRQCTKVVPLQEKISGVSANKISEALDASRPIQTIPTAHEAPKAGDDQLEATSTVGSTQSFQSKREDCSV